MNSKPLLIFGAGAFAEIAHYYFTQETLSRVIAFVVDGAFLRESSLQGLPVVAWDEAVERYSPDTHDMFIAVGLDRLNRTRAERGARAEQAGYRLAHFVSPRADVPAGLTIGPNTMIMERAGIQPMTHIGRNTVIWPTTRVGFRTRIGNHCWLVSCIFGESCVVEDFSFVGLNATVAPHVQIATQNIIGAGALITRNTSPEQVYRGAVSQPSPAPSHRLRLR